MRLHDIIAELQRAAAEIGRHTNDIEMLARQHYAESHHLLRMREAIQTIDV